MKKHAILIATASAFLLAATYQQLRRDTHERLNAVLWMQTSAEYEVLAAVTYRQATSALRDALAKAASGQSIPSAALEQAGTNSSSLPFAVILDVDETVLDNSPMSGRLVGDRQGYEQSTWDAWVAKEAANLIPGAREYIEFAQASGVKVFLVTNRTAAEQDHTLRDLRPFQFDDASLLASGEIGPGENSAWPSEKTSRRSYIARTHWILGMVGDDLADFVPRIRSLPASERKALARQHLDRMGTQWFLLPNPLYGSWEAALVDLRSADTTQLRRKRELVTTF